MDLAGGTVAYDRANGRVVTVAIDAITFHEPVSIGDVVSCYAVIERIGTTSIRVKVDTFVRRRHGHNTVKVTEGAFTYVAIDDSGRPRPVDESPVNRNLPSAPEA